MANYVTLSFTVADAGQDAETGSVIIKPTSVVTDAGTTVVSQDPVTRAFSGGAASASLFACDNTGTSPAPGFWAYEITLPGGNPAFYLVNFANGATQRFDSLTPVVAQTTYGPAASGAVTSVFGRSGAVTAQTGDYTAAQTGALAAQASSTSVPAAALSPKVTTLTDGASVALNAALGNDFRWTLGGSSHTLAAPSNPADGQCITIAIKYTGSFTPLFNAAFDFAAAGAPSWSAASGKTDYVGFRYDASLASGAGAWAYQGSVLGLTS